MSILHPRDRNYKDRAFVLQVVGTFIGCGVFGPMAGYLARESTDSRWVWHVSIVSFAVAIGFLGVYGREKYIQWGEVELLKRRIADARERYARMYREVSLEVAALRANKAVDSQEYGDKTKRIDYMVHLLTIQKGEVDYLVMLLKRKKKERKHR